METKKGFVYILYHASFVQYGEDVYKLGLTKNPKQRLKSYTTGFVDSCTFLYISSLFHDCYKAERVLFYLLKNKRLRENREFFKVPLSDAKNTIQKLENLSKEELDKLYAQIHLGLLTYTNQMRLLSPDDYLEDDFDVVEYDEDIEDNQDILEDDAIVKKKEIEKKKVADFLNSFKYRQSPPIHLMKKMHI
jgi:hypothetical protein